MALVLASCADSHSLGASHEFVQSDECEVKCQKTQSVSQRR